MPVDILDMLKEPRMTKVCAPMVRYSKLPFRTMVRRYNCDLCFTPMILADSFVQSAKARESEFTTNAGDYPLVAQFAAKDADDFADAAEIISPYCNGADLNCGCPQRWAMKDGYGSDLLTKPQIVKDLVLAVRNRISKPFTVSVKIRLLQDIRKTVELCRTLEIAGVSFITVHARTPQMRKEPIDLKALKTVRDCVTIPLIANGDVKSLRDAERLYAETEYDGVMSANGILANPALFSGAPVTPLSCVQDWLNITHRIPTHFLCMHHHLVFMLEKILPKSERLVFNALQSKETVLTFIDDYYGIRPSEIDPLDMLQPSFCDYDAYIGRKRRKSIVNVVEDGENDPLGNLFCDDT